MWKARPEIITRTLSSIISLNFLTFDGGPDKITTNCLIKRLNDNVMNVPDLIIYTEFIYRGVTSVSC